MLQDVADGKDGVDYILVFKLSRLANMGREVCHKQDFMTS